MAAFCLFCEEKSHEEEKKKADNHEKHGENPKCEEEMDRYNNREGRDCFRDSARSCEDCCSDKQKNGTLKTLD